MQMTDFFLKQKSNIKNKILRKLVCHVSYFVTRGSCVSLIVYNTYFFINIKQVSGTQKHQHVPTKFVLPNGNPTSYSPLPKGKRRIRTLRTESRLFTNGSQQRAKTMITSMPSSISLTLLQQLSVQRNRLQCNSTITIWHQLDTSAAINNTKATVLNVTPQSPSV